MAAHIDWSFHEAGAYFVHHQTGCGCKKCHRRDLYPFRASGFEDHCRPDDSTVAQGSGTVLCRSSGAAILWRAGRFYDFGASDGSGAGRRRCDCQKSQLMGATDPKKAAPGTIRADFADNIDANAVHGSDSPENAQAEITFFFAHMELHAR